MDLVMALINQFKAEETNKLDNIDKSGKPGVILSLENYADDERVIVFLLSVAADENEYDLARIEAFKVFEVKDFDDLAARTRIGHIIGMFWNTRRMTTCGIMLQWRLQVTWRSEASTTKSN